MIILPDKIFEPLKLFTSFKNNIVIKFPFLNISINEHLPQYHINLSHTDSK